MFATKTNKFVRARNVRSMVARRQVSKVVYDIKPSHSIQEMLREAIKKANEVCVSSSNDKECMLQWDEVCDLSKAYHKAVEFEKKLLDRFAYDEEEEL